jgi:hypothetical protein
LAPAVTVPALVDSALLDAELELLDADFELDEVQAATPRRLPRVATSADSRSQRRRLRRDSMTRPSPSTHGAGIYEGLSLLSV